MRSTLYPILEASGLLVLSIFWCELVYYYFVFLYSCPSWPGPQEAWADNNLTKILVLADTHIMGSIKSVKIDKIRREWQMKQAFSISNSIYKPDVLVFLGDLFDEGSFSPDESFDRACSDFDRIFAYDKVNQERIIVPGNHDVGFHDQMVYYPYLLQRFINRYKTTPNIGLVKSPKFNNLNIIVINSMSFYNDTCSICSHSIAATEQLANYLDGIRNKNSSQFSAPIILKHIPLYRVDDLNCIYPSYLHDKVKKINFEGNDVFHIAASRFILRKLRPRLILSGHSHMECQTTHNNPDIPEETVNELTLSSFNHKYAEVKPNFLLLSANSTHVFTKYCNLVDEWVIVAVYVTTVIIIVTRLIILL